MKRLAESLELVFFFKAEDGIRDKLVTGVQTCALPIWGGQERNQTDAKRFRVAQFQRTRNSPNKERRLRANREPRRGIHASVPKETRAWVAISRGGA